MGRVFTSQRHSSHTYFVDAEGVREVPLRREKTSQKISRGPTFYEHVDIWPPCDLPAGREKTSSWLLWAAM